MTFDLEPHDIGWDENAPRCECRTHATRNGQRWRVGVETQHQRSGRLLFQRDGGPLLVAVHLGFSQHGPTELPLNHSPEPFEFRLALADCLANAKWCRTLFLNSQAKLRQPGEKPCFQVVLSPSGTGSWRVLRASEPPEPGIEIQNHAEFFWSRGNAGLVTGEAKTLWASLEAQWNDPDSDFGFAQRFASMNEAQSQEQLWSWKRGDLFEMTCVLKWAFLAQEELWQTPDKVLWTIHLKLQAERQSSGGSLWPNPTPPALPALKEAFRLVLDWFGPQPRHEHIEHHLCLRRRFTESSPQLQLEARQPSAHERLEGALEWRAWLARVRDA